jgi:hypothetical protein
VRSQTAAIRSEGVCASQSVSDGSTAPERMIRVVTTRSGNLAIVTPEAYHGTAAAPEPGGHSTSAPSASAQRTRFQLRRPSAGEGGVCCKPELGGGMRVTEQGLRIDEPDN